MQINELEYREINIRLICQSPVDDCMHAACHTGVVDRRAWGLSLL